MTTKPRPVAFQMISYLKYCFLDLSPLFRPQATSCSFSWWSTNFCMHKTTISTLLRFSKRRRNSVLYPRSPWGRRFQQVWPLKLLPFLLITIDQTICFLVPCIFLHQKYLNSPSFPGSTVPKCGILFSKKTTKFFHFCSNSVPVYFSLKYSLKKMQYNLRA